MAWFFRHDSCSNRLKALAEQVADLTVHLNTAKRQLDDNNDYLDRLLARLDKRDERAKRVTRAAPEAPDERYAHLDPISAAILQRRNGGK